VAAHALTLYPGRTPLALMRLGYRVNRTATINRETRAASTRTTRPAPQNHRRTGGRTRARRTAPQRIWSEPGSGAYCSGCLAPGSPAAGIRPAPISGASGPSIAHDGISNADDCAQRRHARARGSVNHRNVKSGGIASARNRVSRGVRIEDQARARARES